MTMGCLVLVVSTAGSWASLLTRSPGGSWQTVERRTLVPMDVGYRIQYLISGNRIDIKYRSDADLTRPTFRQRLLVNGWQQMKRCNWARRSRSAG